MDSKAISGPDAAVLGNERQLRELIESLASANRELREHLARLKEAEALQWRVAELERAIQSREQRRIEAVIEEPVKRTAKEIRLPERRVSHRMEFKAIGRGRGSIGDCQSRKPALIHPDAPTCLVPLPSRGVPGHWFVQCLDCPSVEAVAIACGPEDPIVARIPCGCRFSRRM